MIKIQKNPAKKPTAIPALSDKPTNVPLMQTMRKRMVRSKKTGCLRHYDKPQKLLADCEKYFEWLAQHPYEDLKVETDGAKARQTRHIRRKAPTIHGLCIFLGISRSIWTRWSNKNDKDGFRADLLPVIEHVEDMMYDEKFGGASAGIYSSRIISRDLGLPDKREVSGPSGSPIEIHGALSLQEKADAYQDLLKSFDDTPKKDKQND